MTLGSLPDPNLSPVFDVSGALAVLNQTLEYAFPFIVVVGELDSFKVSKGKWVYADIKDDYAKLKLFGTVFSLPGPLEDGMMVEVVARPQIHPQYGFSLSVQSIRATGEGSLKKASLLLASKLQAEGLFDVDRKRIVPKPPTKVGLITSSESAAYADFIKIMNARWGGVVVEVFDAQVQGESAVESLISGINFFNQQSELCDALVLIRGGGSVDDLAAFSHELLVRAVAGSRIPTVVAIGHEIDESLAELAADLRASTPSNAAELLFPDKNSAMTALNVTRARLSEQVSAYLDLKQSDIERNMEVLQHAVQQHIDVRLERLEHARVLLQAIHPSATLKRGYALVTNDKGQLISSATNTHDSEVLNLTFKDGSVRTKVEKA